MRIFERLRGRSRHESAIERRIFEAVTDDLLRKLEDALRFPCRRKSGVWYNVWMDEALLIHPSQWRSWR